jgi:PhnB protein
VDDVDAVFKTAVDAGAKCLMEPADQFWGDRFAKVSDPFGHEWSIATPLAKSNGDETSEPDPKRVKTVD